MNQPENPHAIVEITRPGASPTDGSAVRIFDSWETTAFFKSADIHLTTGENSEASISFFDPKFRFIDSYADLVLSGANGTTNIPLETVRVWLGYGADLGEPVFKGLLARVEREDSDTKFIAYDMGFKMKLVKKAGYKNRKDDLGIIKDLAVRNGLQFKGPAKPKKLEPHRAMIQDEQTDWEHATERARDSGLILYVRGDTLFADYPAQVDKDNPPKKTFINRKTATLLHGLEFNFKVPEARDGAKVVERRGRGKGGKRLAGQSTESERGVSSLSLKRDTPGKHTKAKLSARAQAQKELEREHAFEGQLKTLFPAGETRIDVRDTVEVQEIGKLFSGLYCCNSVSYQFAPGRLGLFLDLYRDVKA